MSLSWIPDEFNWNLMHRISCFVQLQSYLNELENEYSGKFMIFLMNDLLGIFAPRFSFYIK